MVQRIGYGNLAILTPVAGQARTASYLRAADAAFVARLTAATADIGLVVNSHDIVLDVFLAGHALPEDVYESWLNRPWVETVTVESRPKITRLLEEARAGVSTRWRQVNHSVAGRPDAPISYFTLALGDTGLVLAIGRDLGAIADLQQRLIAAQQASEREYGRFRQIEVRSRLLFETAPESVLVVDALNQRVLEANAAAVTLLGRLGRRATGWPLAEAFHSASETALVAAMAVVRASGRPGEVTARLAGTALDVTVSIAAFRQDRAPAYLIRLAPVQGGLGDGGSGDHRLLARAAESLPDGLVVAGADQRILVANAGFLDLVHAADREGLRGQPLDRWIGRSDAELDVLLDQVRARGTVRDFVTVVRGEHGTTTDVDIQAAMTGDSTPVYSLLVRDLQSRAAGEADALLYPRSLEQFSKAVGRMPLKDIVRDATTMIERLSIESALELTGDNRASAAEMLGLSRQSLYVKLRRYGLGDLGGDGSDDTADDRNDS